MRLRMTVRSGHGRTAKPQHGGVRRKPQTLARLLPGSAAGPSLLDRAHQLSFGGYADLPGGLQFSVISHFWSPLSASVVVPNTNLGPGEIFHTDFTERPRTRYPEHTLGTSAAGSTPRTSTVSSPNTTVPMPTSRHLPD